MHAVDLATQGSEPLPLTRVLPNNRCYVLDARQRLTPVGVSFASPVAANSSDEGRAKNRRVELVPNN